MEKTSIRALGLAGILVLGLCGLALPVWKDAKKTSAKALKGLPQN